jgi:hypothetical protein
MKFSIGNNQSFTLVYIGWLLMLIATVLILVGVFTLDPLWVIIASPFVLVVLVIAIITIVQKKRWPGIRLLVHGLLLPVLFLVFIGIPRLMNTSISETRNLVHSTINLVEDLINEAHNILQPNEERKVRKKWLVLSSGDGTKNTEEWYVDENLLLSLPSYNPVEDNPPVTPQKAVKIAERHAFERYHNRHWVVTSIELKRFAQDTFHNGPAKDWVYLVSLQYNYNDATQIVPVLLNSTILPSERPSELEESQ